MALEVGEGTSRHPANPEQEVLGEEGEETDGLRAWRLHFEGWVDGQVVATRALVDKLIASRELEAERPRLIRNSRPIRRLPGLPTNGHKGVAGGY
jgi:hypothetical protein